MYLYIYTHYIHIKMIQKILIITPQAMYKIHKNILCCKSSPIFACVLPGLSSPAIIQQFEMKIMTTKQISMTWLLKRCRPTRSHIASFFRFRYLPCCHDESESFASMSSIAQTRFKIQKSHDLMFVYQQNTINMSLQTKALQLATSPETNVTPT